MPELPEVETTRRGIAAHIVGKKVQQVRVRNSHLRWPVPANLPHLLKGKTLLGIQRRAKYLLFEFTHGTVLWHLGMSGNLRIILDKQPLKKHDHIDVVFAGGSILRFHDPRRFGCVLWTADAIEQHSLIKNLGPEPLGDLFDAAYLYARAKRSTKTVKTWIMDGHVVVGVGNIYANEALFAAGIHPGRKANALSLPQCACLVDEIRKVLACAIERGGTTLRDFVGGDGKPGYFAQELKVYGRGGEPCVRCGKPLTEKALGQRSTVYCTVCQK